MKKTIITSLALWLLASGVLMYSCQKEKQINSLSPTNGESVYENEYGKFKKEITVKDEGGKNSLFLTLYSDNQDRIDEYINNNELKLHVESAELIETIKRNVSENSEREDEQKPRIEKEQQGNPGLTVIVLAVNLEKNISAYSLEVSSKRTIDRSQLVDDFIPAQNSYITAYGPDESDFIGVIHDGRGYWIEADFRLRNKKVSFWHSYKKVRITNGGYNYMAVSSYRTGVNILPDYRAALDGVPGNYKVVYQREHYTKNTCSYMGTYKEGNCYVGTPPSGTTAFIYGSVFYHTPVPGATTIGTKCPMGGWDGANCGVIRFTSAANSPFIYGNEWYVRADVLHL